MTMAVAAARMPYSDNGHTDMALPSARHAALIAAKDINAVFEECTRH